MNSSLPILTNAIDVLHNFSDDYSEMKTTALACAERARDSIYDLSEILDELCEALENLPE